jgi:hypothetical protein
MKIPNENNTDQFCKYWIGQSNGKGFCYNKNEKRALCLGCTSYEYDGTEWDKRKN